MTETVTLQSFLEHALAFAHAALEDPTQHLERARAYAEDVLPRVERLKKGEFTLAEARQIVLLTRQLKRVLDAARAADPPGRVASSSSR